MSTITTLLIPATHFFRQFFILLKQLQVLYEIIISPPFFLT